jgi:ribonuclease E
MTRQRIRPSLKRSAYKDCPCCRGSAVVKTPESMAIDVIRQLIVIAQKPTISRVELHVNTEVSDYLNNRKRHELARLEDEGSMAVQIIGDEKAGPEDLLIRCWDADDREVRYP